MNEATITINGQELTEAQAMTVRVALNSFLIELADGLGDDEHGKQMTALYRERAGEVLNIVHNEITRLERRRHAQTSGPQCINPNCRAFTTHARVNSHGLCMKCEREHPELKRKK